MKKTSVKNNLKLKKNTIKVLECEKVNSVFIVTNNLGKSSTTDYTSKEKVNNKYIKYPSTNNLK